MPTVLTADAVKAAGRLGIKITGLPKRRAKLPKTKLGGIVDEIHDLRERRLAVDKVANALKAEETRLVEHIIESVDADLEGGAMGIDYVGTVRRETIPVIEDWDAFYTYVKKRGAFHFLTKALNKGAIMEQLDDKKAKPLPGVGTMIIKKLGITKRK